MINYEEFQQAELKGIRDGFGQALVELGQEDGMIAAVCADLRESIRMQAFADAFPDRFFEVGVAEQNLIGVASGLAKEGFTAFAGSYAAFSPGRTHDQIRVSVCYANRNVKIIGGHAGLTVGPDGATHQALEDLALMRVLPNMTVVVPSDFESARVLTRQIAALTTPAYLRSSRVKTRSLARAEEIQLGKVQVMREGFDLTIMTCGVMVDRALQLAFDLEQQAISVEVLNVHTIKPLDRDAILASAHKTGKVLTLEEHQQFGGLGSAVAELLIQQAKPIPMRILGVQDTFGESGEADELLDKYGFERSHLVQTALEFLNQR
jgi:transketolase